MRIAAPLFLTLVAIGPSRQAEAPVHVGQWARTLLRHKWLAGVVHTGIAGSSERPKCLSLNLDESGLPFSVWLHAEDSMEVWVPKPGAPASTGGHAGMGHWVGIGPADRTGQLCP